MGKVPVVNELQASRHELLTQLKKTVFKWQDCIVLVRSVWCVLWEIFTNVMSKNRYLFEWHGGEAIAKEWNKLSVSRQSVFVDKMFNFDKNTMIEWLNDCDNLPVEHPSVRKSEQYAASLDKQLPEAIALARYGALGQENEFFTRQLRFLLNCIPKYVVQKGYQ